MSTTQVGPELVKQLRQVAEGLKVGRVCGDRILVATVTPRTDMDRAQERSNIVIPDDVKAKNSPLPSTGLVVAVGSSERAQEFQEGEAVMFSSYAGSDISESNSKDKYRILGTHEVLCVLEADGEMSEVIQAA